MAIQELFVFFFFFQAEDGIRDHCVTGVQTCALPICGGGGRRGSRRRHSAKRTARGHAQVLPRSRRSLGRQRKIGRASCRERGEISGVAVSLKKKKKKKERK